MLAMEPQDMYAKVYYNTNDPRAIPQDGAPIDLNDFSLIEEFGYKLDGALETARSFTTIDHLEHVFGIYNNADGSTRTAELKIRSMSVGDIVALSQYGRIWSWHMCTPDGWDNVSARATHRPQV